MQLTVNRVLSELRHWQNLPLSLYFFITAIVSLIKRRIRNRLISMRYTKKYRSPFPDVGYNIIVPRIKQNGLGRAYLFEIDRLKREGLINPKSRNVIIFSQPRSYWKNLRNVSIKFETTYRIGFMVTEFAKMPSDWHFCASILNEIWTPSQFSANALQALSLPISIREHCVKVNNKEIFDRAEFEIPEKSFLGIAIMDIGTCPERKNPIAHINAWRLAFGNDERAILLLKVRFGKKKNFYRRRIMKELNLVKNVRIIEREFDEQQMEKFQNMADVFLSLHRCEGFGLNIKEMLDRGKPVIATGYSGNMQYMARYSNAFPVKYKLVPCHDITFHYLTRNLVWAEADQKDAAQKLRYLRSAWADQE